MSDYTDLIDRLKHMEDKASADNILYQAEVTFRAYSAIESLQQQLETSKMMLEENGNLVNDHIEKCKELRSDLAAIGRDKAELAEVVKSARALDGVLSASFRELLDKMIAKHSEGEA